MPTPEIHAQAAAQSTALAMVTLATIGQSLGLDYVAMFYAFMGAVCWRAMQPRIAPSFDEVSKAFGWVLCGLLFGSLGSVWIEAILTHYWQTTFTGLTHPELVGFPAFILSFFIVFIFTKITKLIQDWKQP